MKEVRKIRISRKERKIQNANIQELLVFIGIPYWDIYKRRRDNDSPRGTRNLRKRSKASFWQRNPSDLPYLLKDAHKAYLSAIKASHPDTNRHSPTDPALINLAWARIKKLFRQKGIYLD